MWLAGMRRSRSWVGLAIKQQDLSYSQYASRYFSEASVDPSHHKNTAMSPQSHGNTRKECAGVLCVFALQQSGTQGQRNRRPVASDGQGQRLIQEVS